MNTATTIVHDIDRLKDLLRFELVIDIPKILAKTLNLAEDKILVFQSDSFNQIVCICFPIVDVLVKLSWEV